MTMIGLVRHGVTDWNQQGRAQGQRDVPLNMDGISQANKVAHRLASENWDIIYSSDLMRASATAEIIARAAGIREIHYDARLREKTHGRLDGTTVEERIELWGENWRELDHGDEKESDMLRRSLHFLQDLLLLHPDGRVLLVSHGAWIKTLLAALFVDKEITFIDNTCVTVIEKHGLNPSGDLRSPLLLQEGWDCLLFNCTKHL